MNFSTALFSFIHGLFSFEIYKLTTISQEEMIFLWYWDTGQKKDHVLNLAMIFTLSIMP